MKYLLATLLLLFNVNAFSQVADTLKSRSAKESRRVNFVAKADIANATKDGIYLNGYVVNMGYEQAEKLNGKTIKVTGKVTIVKGLNSEPQESDKNGGKKLNRDAAKTLNTYCRQKFKS